MTRSATFLGTILSAIMTVGCVFPAQAANRIYLRSGTDLVCDHQAKFGDQVRLYLTTSEDNYLEVSATDILREEPVADIPAKPTPGVAPTANQTVHPATLKAPDLQPILDHAAAAHHLDPDLLASVVRQESGGHVHAVSHAGAQGLMQLMPGTATYLGVKDSFVPEENIAGGTTYLDALLMYYHDDLALALAAYNAGPAAVARYHGVPPYPETRRYVADVIHEYNRRKLREARKVHTTHSSASLVASAIAHP